MKNKLLFLAISSFLFFGCFSQSPRVQYVEKPIFIKCKIPDIPKASLEEIPDNATYPEKLKIILNNYFELKKENELLREAIKLCR